MAVPVVAWLRVVAEEYQGGRRTYEDKDGAGVPELTGGVA